MLVRILIALSVVFGLIVANPVEESSLSSRNDIEVFDSIDAANYELVKTDAFAIIFDVITSLIGFKVTSVTIATAVIKWLVSNCVTIAFGAIATLSFCKLTGKCNLLYSIYDDFVPIAQLRNLVTSEYLETAEKILVSAVEKYAQEMKSSKTKNLSF